MECPKQALKLNLKQASVWLESATHISPNPQPPSPSVKLFHTLQLEHRPDIAAITPMPVLSTVHRHHTARTSMFFLENCRHRIHASDHLHVPAASNHSIRIATSPAVIFVGHDQGPLLLNAPKLVWSCFRSSNRNIPVAAACVDNHHLDS